MLACFFLQTTCNCESLTTRLWVSLRITAIKRRDQELSFAILATIFEIHWLNLKSISFCALSLKMIFITLDHPVRGRHLATSAGCYYEA